VTAPTSDEFRQAMGLLPTGVTVVTAPSEGGPLGATANAVSSLSLAPPLMLASLDVGSRTLGAIRSAGRFGISVLGGDQEAVARAFATKAPSAEKWADVPAESHDGVPLIAGVPLWVVCELREAHTEGDHVILIGAVGAVGGEGGYPLVFHRGTYRAL
jgi:3-hydroxy-9,10-secoandrosta-1,3,5(10)-triene-9,17-dione monooxygenase reductase component